MESLIKNLGILISANESTTPAERRDARDQLGALLRQRKSLELIARSEPNALTPLLLKGLKSKDERLRLEVIEFIFQHLLSPWTQVEDDCLFAARALQSSGLLASLINDCVCSGGDDGVGVAEAVATALARSPLCSFRPSLQLILDGAFNGIDVRQQSDTIRVRLMALVCRLDFDCVLEHVQASLLLQELIDTMQSNDILMQLNVIELLGELKSVKAIEYLRHRGVLAALVQRVERAAGSGDGGFDSMLLRSTIRVLGQLCVIDESILPSDAFRESLVFFDCICAFAAATVAAVDQCCQSQRRDDLVALLETSMVAIASSASHRISLFNRLFIDLNGKRVVEVYCAAIGSSRREIVVCALRCLVVLCTANQQCVSFLTSPTLIRPKPLTHIAVEMLRRESVGGTDLLVQLRVACYQLIACLPNEALHAPMAFPFLIDRASETVNDVMYAKFDAVKALRDAAAADASCASLLPSLQRYVVEGVHYNPGASQGSVKVEDETG